jgi:putative ABC transport system permease protein
MVDDAQALLDNSGADLWVVQKDTLGPYAEPSSLNEDSERPIQAMRGVDASGGRYLPDHADRARRQGRAGDGRRGGNG